jgi:hypothetical protein
MLGLGTLGDDPNVLINRKWRYTFEADFPSGKIPEQFVKIAGRPEPEHKLLNTTFYDMSYDTEVETYKIMSYMFQFGADLIHKEGFVLDSIQEMLGKAKLSLYDGTANLLEQWLFDGIWAKGICFGDLDHSSCEMPILEVTWMFQSMSRIMPVEAFPSSPEWTKTPDNSL